MKGIDRIIFGRFMLPDLSEHGCQITDISVDGATFIADHIPAEGQSLVAYVEQLGRIEAVSTAAAEKSFRVAFSATGARRERLISRLHWLAEKRSAQVQEERRFIRRELPDAGSKVTMLDGRTYPCEVLDISLTGAGVAIDVMPTLGLTLFLGKMRGRVVRYIERGIAIEFTTALPGGQLSEVINNKP